MSQKASKAGKDIGAIAVGGAVAYAGALAIIAAVVVVLGEFLDNYWLSALIVGIIVAAVGYFLIQRGLEALKRIDPAPKQTIETLKEDREWLKEQTQ
jgi:drug/metabolite transporter (DMT)-like permease